MSSAQSIRGFGFHRSFNSSVVGREHHNLLLQQHVIGAVHGIHNDALAEELKVWHGRLHIARDKSGGADGGQHVRLDVQEYHGRVLLQGERSHTGANGGCDGAKPGKGGGTGECDGVTMGICWGAKRYIGVKRGNGVAGRGTTGESVVSGGSMECKWVTMAGGAAPCPLKTPALTLLQRHFHAPTPAQTAYPTASNRNRSHSPM